MSHPVRDATLVLAIFSTPPLADSYGTIALLHSPLNIPCSLFDIELNIGTGMQNKEQGIVNEEVKKEF
jgi:hypothetical protein